MKCPKCGTEQAADAKFCGYCGEKIEPLTQNKDILMYCKYCGSSLKKGAAFCTSCGKQIEYIPAAAPVPMPTFKTVNTPPMVTFAETTRPTRPIWLAIVGFVLAFFSWIPIVSIFTFVPGLIFSIKGLKSRNRGFARTAIILYSISSIILIIAVFSML